MIMHQLGQFGKDRNLRCTVRGCDLTLGQLGKVQMIFRAERQI